MSEIVIFIAILIPLLIGALGTILPFLPGLPLMFFVVLFYGFLDSFNNITINNLIVLGLIALISIIIDYLSGLMGAKFFGSSKVGILGGFIGSIVGLFLLPPFGLIIGLFLGVLIAEMFYSKKSHQKAIKSAGGAIVGSLAGIIVNLILAITFITLFSIYFWN